MLCLNTPLFAWMLFLNKLTTVDKLCSWGIAISSDCLLCESEMESRDHIFFSGNFSEQVWQMVLEKCGLKRMVRGWYEESNWADR